MSGQSSKEEELSPKSQRSTVSDTGEDQFFELFLKNGRSSPKRKLSESKGARRSSESSREQSSEILKSKSESSLPTKKAPLRSTESTAVNTYSPTESTSPELSQNNKDTSRKLNAEAKQDQLLDADLQQHTTIIQNSKDQLEARKLDDGNGVISELDGATFPEEEGVSRGDISGHGDALGEGSSEVQDESVSSQSSLEQSNLSIAENRTETIDSDISSDLYEECELPNGKGDADGVLEETSTETPREHDATNDATDGATDNATDDGATDGATDGARAEFSKQNDSSSFDLMKSTLSDSGFATENPGAMSSEVIPPEHSQSTRENSSDGMNEDWVSDQIDASLTRRDCLVVDTDSSLVASTVMNMGTPEPTDSTSPCPSGRVSCLTNLQDSTDKNPTNVDDIEEENASYSKGNAVDISNDEPVSIGDGSLMTNDAVSDVKKADLEHTSTDSSHHFEEEKQKVSF